MLEKGFSIPVIEKKIRKNHYNPLVDLDYCFLSLHCITPAAVGIDLLPEANTEQLYHVYSTTDFRVIGGLKRCVFPFRSLHCCDAHCQKRFYRIKHKR